MHPPEGSHEAMVVDTQWHDATTLEVSVTLTAGELKGAVVDVPLETGTPAYVATFAAVGASAEGVEAGDDMASIAFLAMPCTLVVAVDGDRVGYALAPP